MKQLLSKLFSMAFCLCVSLNATAVTTATVGYLKYQFEGNSAYIIGYDENTIPEALVIPEKVEWNGLTFNVTKIDDKAFYCCKKIKSLKINHRLLSIGEYAFYTSTLETIDVNADNLGRKAFYGSHSLKKATVHARNLLARVFAESYHLESVTLDGVVDIYGSAFFCCRELKRIDFGNSLQRIGNTAFYRCTSLTYLVFPPTLNSTEFNYTGSAPVPSYTCDQPAGFKPTNASSLITSLEKNAGSYSVSLPITFSNGDDSFTANIPYNYTIKPLTLPARVKDVTKEYGTANPQFQSVYTGFVSGEDESVITKKGTYTTAANTNSNVGTYSISQSGAVAQNYVFKYEEGTMTISKAPLIIIPRDKSMVYGDRLPNLEVDYLGLKNNETKPAWIKEPSVTTTATSTSIAGTYPIVVSGGEARNYDLTFKEGTLTISKATLTATTRDVAREYGSENPDFMLTYSRLKNGESEPAWTVAPTFATPATKTSPVGVYAITANGGEARNYMVQYINAGKLTIEKAPLMAKARSYAKKQGEENPVMAVDYTGFKNGETKIVLTQEPIATTTANRNSRPGTYPITVSGGIAMNYEFNYVDGTLTVLAGDENGADKTNYLTMDNLVTNKNVQAKLPIALTNDKAITGVQFDLYLPDGVTVAKNSKGKLLISTILTVTLNIGDDVAVGDYTIRIKDILLSDVNNTESHPVDVGAVLTVKSFALSDVDNSGTVNINDVVTLINRYILNKNNSQARMSKTMNRAAIPDNNYLHLATINIQPGETQEIQLMMTNANTVAAVQGNVKLPVGLSFATKSNIQLTGLPMKAARAASLRSRLRPMKMLWLAPTMLICLMLFFLLRV